MPIVGNVPDVLEELMKQLEAIGTKPDAAVAQWWETIADWRGRNCPELS